MFLRTAALLCWIPLAALPQDPYKVAADHYHLLFQNEWAAAARVTYGPHESSPVHDHPATPTTVYVYVTDGGAIRFHHFSGHVAGQTIERPPVQAGAIRYARGAPETHSAEYLGDAPSEYVRIELRTALPERPDHDVRLPPVALDPSQSVVQLQYENGQIRILRVMCATADRCPESPHPTDPAVVIVMSGRSRGEVKWSPEGMAGPEEQVRIELKTKPLH